MHGRDQQVRQGAGDLPLPRSCTSAAQQGQQGQHQRPEMVAQVQRRPSLRPRRQAVTTFGVMSA